MDRSASRGAKRVQTDEFITEDQFDSILRLERTYVDANLRKIEVALDKRIHEMTSRLRSDITAELLERVLDSESSMSKKLETSHQLQENATNAMCRRLDGKLSDIQKINGSLAGNDHAVVLSQEQQIKKTEIPIARLQIDMDALKADMFPQGSRCTDSSPVANLPCTVSATSTLEDLSQFASSCLRVTAFEKHEQVAHSSVYDVPAPTDCAQCLDISDVSTADSGAVVTAPLRSSVEAIRGDMESLVHETMTERLDRPTGCVSVSGSGKAVQNLVHARFSWREKRPVAALSFLEPCGASSESVLPSLEACALRQPLGIVESAILACASPSRPSPRVWQGHQMSISPTKTLKGYCFPKHEEASEEIEAFLKGIASVKSPL